VERKVIECNRPQEQGAKSLQTEWENGESVGQASDVARILQNASSIVCPVHLLTCSVI
jgi:hypothetical protein